MSHRGLRMLAFARVYARNCGNPVNGVAAVTALLRNTSVCCHYLCGKIQISESEARCAHLAPCTFEGRPVVVGQYRRGAISRSYRRDVPNTAGDSIADLAAGRGSVSRVISYGKDPFCA